MVNFFLAALVECQSPPWVGLTGVATIGTWTRTTSRTSRNTFGKGGRCGPSMLGRGCGTSNRVEPQD